MAHYETELSGTVDDLVAHLDRAIASGSITASNEAGSDHRIGDARMVVQVYERYSAMGGNRVSLSISILNVGDRMALSAVTSGGSKATFFKVNTLGGESFLHKAIEAIESFPR